MDQTKKYSLTINEKGEYNISQPQNGRIILTRDDAVTLYKDLEENLFSGEDNYMEPPDPSDQDYVARMWEF